ncbi:MAG: FAD-dependent oxidoreductase [Granulosicoccus sp.]|nr:FAD-dependent oxidoreductase [Granulosicoccus sp.]
MSSDIQNSVILVGGGHTHALVLNALKDKPLINTSVTVINPGKTAPYSGMLPGFVAGHYQRAELDIDLHQLSHDVGATLVDGKAVSIDTEKRLVYLEDGTNLPYNLASVDVGITSHMNDLPGFSDYAVPAKPLGNFASKWDEYRSAGGPKQVVVIGGGIAGAELAMAMSFALKANRPNVSVKILDRSQILSASSVKTQKCIRQKLKANYVSVSEQVNVIKVTPNGVDLADGSSIAANFVVGAAGATPHAWLSNTGLNLYKGFVIVNEHLQTNMPDVFAVGDCAHMEFDPRPKAGVYAVRQAPVLLHNIRMALSNAQLSSYKPQTDYLKLISLGDKEAFGEKMGWGISGRLVWRLKNYIDQSFMNQF